MDKKANFSESTVILAKCMCNGFCMVDGCIEKADEIHHKLPNTLLNNKKSPLFIQSIFNAFPICRNHHDNYGNLKNVRITIQQAEAYETWLKKFKEE